MSQTVPPFDADHSVLVELTSDWSSGTASVHCTLHFKAYDLDQALALIRRATAGAPILNNPLEEGQQE